MDPSRPPKRIINEIQETLGRLTFTEEESPSIYRDISAKVAELREWKVDEELLGNIDEAAQQMLGMRPAADTASTFSWILGETEEWKAENPG